MSTAKALLYSSSLDSARTLSAFEIKYPTDLTGKLSLTTATTTVTQGQEWKELIRKFSKHNPAREVTTQAALVDHLLHILLAKAAQVSQHHHDTSYANVTPNSGGKPNLIWTPSVLKEDRQQLDNALTALSNTISNVGGTTTEKNSARIIRAHGLYAIRDFDGALIELERVDLNSTGGEAYDMTLRVVANAIQGFAFERKNNVRGALAAYASAGRIYGDLSTATKSSKTIEADRFVEEAMFRLCLWSRSSDDIVSPFPPHRLYLNHSARWSTLFRPTKLILIHRGLRTLLHDSGITKSSPDQWRSEVMTNNLAQEIILRQSTSLPKAGEVNQPYLDFLDEVVEGWRIGGGGSEGAAQIVEILYNALTHTFQSQRLLRHLVRVLTARAAYVEAGKVLRLYVEIFDKARETDSAQVARDLRKFHAERQIESGNGENEDEKQMREGAEEDHEFDIDSDREFIQTLLFGVRLLCKYLNDPEEGLRLATRARTIFDEQKDQALSADKAEEGKIERALGIALGALTAKAADLETRPENHGLALQHLESAVALDPTSWSSQYHLAFQLSELRQVTPALEAARQAVKLNHASVEGWHLLGLLVSAQKNLGESLLVLETGIEEGRLTGSSRNDTEAEEEEEEEENEVSHLNGESPSIVVSTSLADGLSFHAGSTKRTPGLNLESPSFGDQLRFSKFESRESISTPTGQKFNSARSTLPPPSADLDLPRDETDVVIAELQIRMTRNVVIEAMEGAEAALIDQQNLLKFFSIAMAGITDEDDTTTAGPTTNGQSNAAPSIAPSRAATPMGRSKSIKSMRHTIVDDAPLSPLKSTKSRTTSIYSSAQPSANQSMVSLPSLAPSRYGSNAIGKNSRATKLLVDLWLMSAASFRRAGQLDDCRGAIAEAETVDADNPDVWVQFALYCVAKGATDDARTSCLKSLAFSLHHPSALIVLSRLYLADPTKLAFAEGLLDNLTKTHGWDIGEAWFELSKCYKGPNGSLLGRPQREKECLIWALQLEETRSVRELACCVPRCL